MKQLKVLHAVELGIPFTFSQTVHNATLSSVCTNLSSMLSLGNNTSIVKFSLLMRSGYGHTKRSAWSSAK